jgi:hypothetical protein
VCISAFAPPDTEIASPVKLMASSAVEKSMFVSNLEELIPWFNQL